MTRHAPSLRSIFLGSLSFVLALGAVACGNVVVRGGGGTAGDENGITDDVPGENFNNDGDANALALFAYQMPWYQNGISSSTSSGGGPGVDPDMLYLIVGDQSQSCSDPSFGFECGSHYQVTIGIPPELQKVGVISLDDPSLISSHAVTGPVGSSGGQECWGGGGSFMDGTIEITAIDDSTVEFTLVDTWKIDFDTDGSYVASRCP